MKGGVKVSVITTNKLEDRYCRCTNGMYYIHICCVSIYAYIYTYVYVYTYVVYIYIYIV